MKNTAKLLTGLLACLLMAACGGAKDAITIVSREAGSGTRAAFVELTGIEQKNESGEKIDRTADTAEETNSTSVMLQSVAGNKSAIGYVSLGSLGDMVKAVTVDGIAPTVDNLKNATYGVARSFYVVTKAETSAQTQDFLRFILSNEGQAAVEAAGYVSTEATGAFTSSGAAGKIVVAGSSSVFPVMEKLKEAYGKINPAVKVEVHTSDSTTGINNTIDGGCDIGMASRAAKDTEIAKGIVPTVIALDGIAVIVNKENPVSALTKEQIRAIFTAEITAWTEISD